MKFLAVFTSFMLYQPVLFSSVSPNQSQYFQCDSTSTAMIHQDSISDDEGMGDRQDAMSDLLAESHGEVSIWRQIMGLFVTMTYSFLNFMTGEY